MTEKTSNKPEAPRGKTKEDRLKAALRENLQRRKAQSRARKAQETEKPEE